MISVLLPVHNAAATLPNTLRSLHWQTCTDWELVAVDDGSTDDSADILRSSPKTRLIQQPHRGLVAALNRGLEHCTGAYVARLDADDLAHPRRLELQKQALEEDPGLALVSSKVRLFPSHVIRSGFRRYERWLNGLLTHEQIERDLLVESPFVHPSVMTRRSWLDDGYRDFDGPEDYDLWLRLYEKGARFAKLPQVLTWWREHPSRLTRQHPAYRQEAIRSLKVQALKRTHLKHNPPVIVWGAGDDGKRLARELRSQGTKVDHFADLNRGRIGQRIDGSPVFSPREPFDPALLAGRFHLAAVGKDGGRKQVRAEMESLGLQELRDYVCLA